MQRLSALMVELGDEMNADIELGPLFYERLLEAQAKRMHQLTQLLTLGDFSRAVFRKNATQVRPRDATQCKRLINEIAQGVEVM